MLINADEIHTALRLDLGPQDGFLTSDMSQQAAAKLWLANALTKKLIPKDTKGPDQAALQIFLKSNEACHSYKPDFPGYYQDIFNDMKFQLEELFWSGPYQTTPFSLRNATDLGMVGPGAARDTNHNDLFTKLFDSSLSTTSLELYDLFRTTIGGRWSLAEIMRAKTWPNCIVNGSKLFFAPKDINVSRSCAVEPNLNMFLQKGYGEIISVALKRFHKIDLSTQQDVNRLMAQQGSINQSFGTIDLKSASDTISLTLCKELLPPRMFDHLNKLRSAFTQLPNGDELELHMMSSMGNGFTFPLQTLIFATLVKAVYRYMGLPTYNGNLADSKGLPQYSVFGDDIIVRREAYNVVVTMLGYCGFTVNESKSFNCGGFRESCGADFWYGLDIRGVYLKKADNEAHIYSIFNRLCSWSLRHNIPLDNLLRYVKGLARFRPVPLHAADHEGIKVPFELLLNPKLNRNKSVIYSSLEPITTTRRIGDPERNLHGALIAFIGGFLTARYTKEGSLSLHAGVRSSNVRYKVVKRLTPCWDFGLDAGRNPRELSNLLESLGS